MFFVQTREKLAHSLLKSLEKHAKIIDFWNFLKKFFENFLKISKQCFFRRNAGKFNASFKISVHNMPK